MSRFRFANIDDVVEFAADYFGEAGWPTGTSYPGFCDYVMFNHTRQVYIEFDRDVFGGDDGDAAQLEALARDYLESSGVDADRVQNVLLPRVLFD